MKRLWIQYLIGLYCSVFALSIAHAAGKSIKRNIELSWEDVPGALKYELKVRRIDNTSGKDMLFQTKSSTWSGNINPGEYEMQIRTYDARGIAGLWSDSITFWAKAPGVELIYPKDKSELLAHKATEDLIKFSWKPISGIANYHFHLRDLDTGEDKVIATPNAKLELQLPVAHTFDWQVVAIQATDRTGEVAEVPFTFTMFGPALEPIQLTEPLSEVLRVIRWKKPGFADHFSAKIEMKNASKWQTKFENKNQKDAEIDFNVEWEPGEYRVTLQAFSFRRKPSPVFSQQFSVGGGIRKPTTQNIVEAR